MKKILLASLFAATSFSASADMLVGGDFELNTWVQTQTVGDNGSDTSGNLTFEGSIEHFIPLVPNLKLAQSIVAGDDLEYTKRDFTLYYEILDNDVASLDLGVGVTQFTDSKVRLLGTWIDFEGLLPHVYAGTEVGIVGTPFFVFAKGLGLGYDDNYVYDYSVGVQYEIPFYAFDIELQAGYRAQVFDFEDFDDVSFDAETKGLFAGVNFDF